MCEPIPNLEPDHLIFINCYRRIFGSRKCDVCNNKLSPLDYRYREIYRNRDEAENIEDSTKPTHVSLDILSAVIVDPCCQLMREDIDGC